MAYFNRFPLLFKRGVPPTGFLVDYSGAAAAFALDTFRSDYSSPLLYVMRSSDSALKYFYRGATAGSLNDVAGGGGNDIVTWIGAGNHGLVAEWYSQDGSGLKATQNNANYMPRIVDNGSLVTENGKPAIKFDGVDDFLTLSSTISGTTPWHVMMVARRLASGTVGPFFGGASSQYSAWLYSDNNWYVRGREGYITSGMSGTSAVQQLLTTEWISASKTMYLNGSSLFSGTPTLPTTDDFIYIGKRGSDYANANCQMVFLWKQDMSASRSAMDTSIKSYFSIP